MDVSVICERALALARALTPETLRDQQEFIRERLAAEDAASAGARRRNMREHADFKAQADAFEEVLRERGIAFTPIPW
jgi:hypothetical protein